jgi:hypothetical protein
MCPGACPKKLAGFASTLNALMPCRVNQPRRIHVPDAAPAPRTQRELNHARNGLATI